MKKALSSSIAACVIVLLYYSFSFAGGLSLVKSYPEDGARGLESTNLMIKLEFNQNISDPSVKAQNEKCFSVYDSNGKSVKCQVLFDNKKSNRAGVLINETLKLNAKYVATIDGALKSADGSTLGTKKQITFYTKDVSGDQGIGTLIIFAAAAAIAAFAVKSAKQKLAEEQDKNKNPYQKNKKEKKEQYKHTSEVRKPKKKKK